MSIERSTSPAQANADRDYMVNLGSTPGPQQCGYVSSPLVVRANGCPNEWEDYM
jgi:hypothetical protein